MQINQTKKKFLKVLKNQMLYSIGSSTKYADMIGNLEEVLKELPRDGS